MGKAFAAIHALVVGSWLGAALITGFVVAPRAFATFATRAEAGSFVGSILWVVNGVAVAAGAVAIGAAVGRGGARLVARYGAGGTLLAVGVVSLALQAKLAAMRAAMGPIDAVPPDDPRRKAFGALHGVSMLVLLVGMIAAAASIALESSA